VGNETRGPARRPARTGRPESAGRRPGETSVVSDCGGILGAVAYDEDLADRLREILYGEEGLTELRMFGGLAFLINGHMAVSASGQGGLLLRVDPADSRDLASRVGAQPFVMRGRAMEGWLRVSPEAIPTRRQLEGWAEIGVAHARSLPPKAKAPRRRRLSP
jgi:hypothetical protein